MTTETNPFLLGVTLKDLDSNVRSEISYLDRNLTAGMKYGDFHRGHIHNNLHSHMGREEFGREGFGREGR